MQWQETCKLPWRALTDQVREGGVAEQEPPPGSDPVSLVLELLRPEVVEVLEERLLDELAVHEGHTVDGVAADDRQVGHVHLAAG